MLFPTHLLAAYVIGRRRSLPIYWVVAGAALPDVLDKPAGTIGLIDLYQSVGHSAITVLAASVVVFAHRQWAALWVGWASHLVLDGVHLLVNGRPGDLRFLAWPVVHHVPAVNLPPLAFLVDYVGTPSFYLELLIWLGVLVVVYRARTSRAARGSNGLG